MKKFAFLILHYITINDTIKTVESIDNLDYQNKEIIIVDNGSSNNSGEQLEKLYAGRNDIHMIISKNNLGFSNGNNLGFQYIKDNLNVDFIVMINNDVYMIQENFCQLITKEYIKSKFDVLGPRIIMNNNTICTYYDKIKTYNEYKIDKLDLQLLYFFNKIYLRPIFSLYLMIKYRIKKIDNINTSIRKEDVMLNGCCLIFSKKYIENFNALDDRTFLYYEEALLYLRIKKYNLKSVYNPLLLVFHNEHSSTNSLKVNKRKKKEFIIKHEINSINILLKELKGEKNND